MGLEEDLARAAAAAEAITGETPAAVLAAAPDPGRTVFLCGFRREDDQTSRSWLALDPLGDPVTDRSDVRDAVSIAVLCEIAVEAVFPGDLDDLRARLVSVRLTEAPEGIEDAEAAAAALQHELGAPPTLASPARLDAVGQAAQRLERALDPTVPSTFAAAMASAGGIVDALCSEVEAAYRVAFTD